MARPEGFEPPTAWFVARYSIQLSYGRMFTAIPGEAPVLQSVLTNSALALQGTPLVPSVLRPGHSPKVRGVRAGESNAFAISALTQLSYGRVMDLRL